MTEVTIEEAKSILENKIERTVITCDGEKLTKQEKIKIKLICLEQMVLGEICLSVLYMVHVFLFGWSVCGIYQLCGWCILRRDCRLLRWNG